MREMTDHWGADPTHQQADIVSVWDTVTETYSASALEGVDYQAHLRVILDCVGNPAGRWFCEVGCGSGIMSAELEKLGAKTVLVDLSQKALSFAKRHLANNGLSTRVCLQNGLQLGFRDCTFDVVWNAGVAEHFQDDGKIALMKEMYRVVRPGGIVFLTVPNAVDAPFRLGKLVDQWRGTWKFGYEDDLTPARLRKLAEHAGLKHLEVFAYNPIVGWWFLPHGRALCEALGLNTLVWHLKRSRFGHVVCLSATKPRLA